MAQTFNDFIKECELFEHSKEHYELMKECAELTLMEKYIEDQTFMKENAVVIGDMNLNESYMPAADTDEKIREITEAAEEKKKSFWAKVWEVISAPFRAIINFFKKIIDKITRKAELEKLEAANAKLKERAGKATSKAKEYYAELLGLRDKAANDAKAVAFNNATIARQEQKIGKLTQMVRERDQKLETLSGKFKGATNHCSKLNAELKKTKEKLASNNATFAEFIGYIMADVTPSGMSFAISAFDGLKTIDNVKALYNGAPATIFIDSEDKIVINPKELANIFAVATSDVDISKNAGAINKVAGELKAAQSKYTKAASIIKKSKKVDVVLSVQELKECLEKLQASYDWYGKVIKDYSANQAVDQMNRSEAGIANYTDVLTVAVDVQKKAGEQIAVISELLAAAQKAVELAEIAEAAEELAERASEIAS